MKKLLFIIFVLATILAVNGQTLEEMEAEKATKNESIAKLKGEVDAIQAKIDAIPGWKIGAFGTIGGSISGFNNWYSKGVPNSAAGNIGLSINPYANLMQSKYFWRNAASINLAWVKLDNLDIDTDESDFKGATDIFGITSLFGYKLTETIALSVLGEYRTTVINNFNNPGFLDAGIGATWTPLKDLIVVVHPLNYNFIFSKTESTYESSMGAKIVADYTKKIGALNFKTNLSAFQSYKTQNFSNWTWTNAFGYTLWKGIGLGFEFGLRNNRQEAFNYALKLLPAETPANDLPTINSVDNKLQTYWIFGLNYNIE